jgi:Flp pilus assembly protein TadD
MPEQACCEGFPRKAIRIEMRGIRPLIGFLTLFGMMFYAPTHADAAAKLRITIPRRSEFTPVQRLNRRGVRAIQDHDYAKAEGLFYKAYLYDPADPFTLNNLGYVSELEGELDRAESFYKLADEQGSDAVIDMSSVKDLVGKPMVYALGRLNNTPMRVNRMNVEAIDLLSHKQGFAAAAVLKKALAVDPGNPFTLNNLGVASEMMGDFSDALMYYNEAAASHSKQAVTITLDHSWRGKPVSDGAEENARLLRKRMSTMNPLEVRANMLTLRGVAEANQNNWIAARQDFR